MEFKDYFYLVTKSLNDNFEKVDNWFKKPEELRLYKPKNGGWDINEILEHISLTNHFLLILIEKAKEKAKEKALKQNVEINLDEHIYLETEIEKLEQIGKHASFDWIRPEHMEPKGGEKLEDIQTKIKNQTKQCSSVLNVLKDGKGLSVKTKMSVNDLGKIDVYQYIHFLSLHAKRHIEQMEKIEKEFKQNNI